MKELLEIDCLILRRKMSPDDELLGLEGKVVEDGQIRDERLELTVPQVVGFIRNDGCFYTAREEDEDLELGGRLEVVEEEERYRLRTVEDTEEKFYLASLPSYEPAD